MASSLAVFPGTFDPITRGHVDLIRRGARLFDRVVVAVAREGRETLFSAEERLALVEAEVAGLEGVAVEGFEGLVVEAARRLGATALLRGVRGARDWDYEMQMAFANANLAPDVDTVFLPPSQGTSWISGSLVREVASLGGDVSPWVGPAVAKALAARLPRA